MNIKMIVTDLDNTLLRHDKTVSEYTADVFKRIRERGVLLAFATARDFRFVTEYVTPLTGITPDILIADNGALARQNGKDLYIKTIPNAIVNQLMPHFESVRNISNGNTYYLSGEIADGHWSIGISETIVTDFADAIDNDAFFVAGIAGSRLLPFVELNPDIRAATYSDVDFVTVVHHEATKLNALMAVQNTLGFENDNIAVFGDDYSDIEMLSSYKHSVAVANAIDECKAVAKYICDANDDDGVAKWLEAFVL